MDIFYHYPPALMNLLIDTIPRLCRSKRDVLLFFRGAGVPRKILIDLEIQLKTDKENLNKYDMTRTVLTKLNEAGEARLRERREVLKRVVEFEDFSSCWENDRLPAQGLVHKIQQLVNVKDSFTRMKMERDEEIRKNQEASRKKLEEEQQKHEQMLENIKNDLTALTQMSLEEHQKRGKLLESLLNRLFEANGILIRESFTLSKDDGAGIFEQIDGVIELDGNVYLVEMKWWSKPLGKGDVAQHLVRIFNRGDARGIFISASGYTGPALKDCEDAIQHKVVVLCTIREIFILLERKSDLVKFLRSKIQAAIIEKNPFYEIL